MLKKILFIALGVMILLPIPSYAGGRKEMINKLNEVSESKRWKYLWCDGFSMFIYTLPFYEDEVKLFEVEGDRRIISIGHWHLSPDNKKIAYTIVRKGSTGGIENSSLYMIDNIGGNPTQLITNNGMIYLIGFLSNDELLLYGYLENNTIKKSYNGNNYICILDLKNSKIIQLTGLGEATIGMANAQTTSHKGELLVYAASGGFVVYNMNTKASRKISIDGDRPILSPDGEVILFRRGGIAGDYHRINSNGNNERLVLSEKRIQTLLRGSGSYRDLKFASWSPESHFVLFSESSDLQKGRQFVLDLDTEEILETKRSKGDGSIF